MHCPPSSGLLRTFQGMVRLLELSHGDAEREREGIFLNQSVTYLIDLEQLLLNFIPSKE